MHTHYHYRVVYTVFDTCVYIAAYTHVYTILYNSVCNAVYMVRNAHVRCTHDCPPPHTHTHTRTTQENVMVSLRAEYNGRAIASLVHAFEAHQRGHEPPGRARGRADRRMMHCLPSIVTTNNDGRLHAEHIYCV